MADNLMALKSFLEFLFLFWNLTVFAIVFIVFVVLLVGLINDSSHLLSN